MEMNDFFIKELKNGVLTLWMDQANKKVNVISLDLIDSFNQLMQEVDSNPEIKSVVLISKKKDFIAGANIEDFKAEKKGDFQTITRNGHQVLGKIEKSKKPVVAAIHGTCFGGGLEIALACSARIASNSSSTKIALPEVKLGLLPGGGGTQRLPRLIGVQNALNMMLTGKNIYAYKAKKMGLVDDLVHKNKLHKAACDLALKIADSPIRRKRKKSLFNLFLENTRMGRSIVFSQAKKMVQKQTEGNYPAPFEIIKCVEVGLNKGFKAGLEEEVIRFEKLILSPESKQLVNLFFTMTDKKKVPFGSLAKEVNTLGMLGAGFMGAGITEVSINKNINVFLKDIRLEYLQSAKKNIWKSINKKIKRKAISKIEANIIMDRIKGQLNYENFKNVDIVIEAVVEKMELKKQMLAEVESVTREDCVFATNTSALPITEIASSAKRPENVVGMHYFSPVPKMPLLEIIKTPLTSDKTIATCYKLGVRQGKTCIVVKDHPGFYVNRILSPYLNEAMLMIEEGGKIQDIDRVFKKLGFPVGPMVLMDEVGIDVGAHVMSGDLMEMVKQRGNIVVSNGLINMFKDGCCGRKNKKGYYKYNAKTGKRKGVDKNVYKHFGGGERVNINKEDISNRGLMIMIKEAALCLEEGIIGSPRDGDIGAIFGIGFLPFSGGPFKYIDTLGATSVVKKMNELQAKFGERFAPPEILVKNAKKNDLFYS